MLRAHVLKVPHEGHHGIVKTKCRLRIKVWWPKVDADAEKSCKSQAVSEYSAPEPMARAYPWQDILGRSNLRREFTCYSGSTIIADILK